jgi:hypothetical protein
MTKLKLLKLIKDYNYSSYKFAISVKVNIIEL